MKLKKIATLGLAAVAIAGLASCDKEETESLDFTAYSDEEMYDSYMQTYEDYLALAESATSSSERYFYFAKAEAYLLDKGLVVPVTTKGGNYAITRAVYGSSPYALWGTDNYKLKNMIVTTSLLKATDREGLKKKNLEARKAASAGGYNIYSDGSHKTSYNPKTEVEALGYTTKTTYNTFYSSFPSTYDLANSYRSVDSMWVSNYTDYLVQYDNAGNITPALAESWTVSSDGKTYTFKIRNGVSWSNSNGEVQANYGHVNANDFVTGMDRCAQFKYTLYMLDPIDSYKAVDDYTLEIKLKDKMDYFLTYLTYNPFTPADSDYITAQGENYGATNTNILYCGAFTCPTLTETYFTMTKNNNYWDVANTTLTEVTVTKDDGGDPTGKYNSIVNDAQGYDAGALNAAMITLAKNDGNLDKYAYVTDTDATSFYGAFNLNRQAFINFTNDSDSTSTKTNDQKVLTRLAVLNTNFRKALIAGLDKVTYNAAVTGTDVAKYSIRNTITPTDYVTLSEATHGYAAGTNYGDVVLGEMQKLGSYVTNLNDGQDAYYNATVAKNYINAAFIELGLSSNDKIYVDYPVYGASTVYVAQAQALKQSIETSLGGKVVINLVIHSTSDSYYNSNYYCDSAAELNYDFDISSGWGPDYGDPSTYLSIFSRQGDMIKITGINAHIKD